MQPTQSVIRLSRCLRLWSYADHEPEFTYFAFPFAASWILKKRHLLPVIRVWHLFP